MNRSRERIRALNDELRMSGKAGSVMLTSGIAALTAKDIEEVLLAVQTFSAFTDDNDPYGEHDCAFLTAADHQVMFKIDYYDRAQTYASPDPSDPQQTCRVLTIMLAAEY